MNEMRKSGRTRRALVATGLAAGLVAFSTASASAAIACRGDVCWHVHQSYVYPPSTTIVIHPDYWMPPPRVIIHPDSWGPVERFTREYTVREYGYSDPDW
jgi:hypothetical protein